MEQKFKGQGWAIKVMTVSKIIFMESKHPVYFVNIKCK